MAMGQALHFPGVSIDKYSAVRHELGWDGAGSTDDGFCVIEWWSSEGAWDTFFAERLMPAFEKVGGLPQPEVTRFAVHASYILS